MSSRDQSLFTSAYSSKKAKGPSTILYYTHRYWRAVHQKLDPRILGCRLTELVVGENLTSTSWKANCTGSFLGMIIGSVYD